MDPLFFLGLAVIPAVIAAGLILWILYSYAAWAWRKLHVAFLKKITLPENPISARTLFSDEPDDRPEYSVAAMKLVNAFQNAPRFHLIQGLGWTITIGRDFKVVPTSTDD